VPVTYVALRDALSKTLRDILKLICIIAKDAAFALKSARQES